MGVVQQMTRIKSGDTQQMTRIKSHQGLSIDQQKKRFGRSGSWKARVHRNSYDDNDKRAPVSIPVQDRMNQWDMHCDCL